MKFDKYMAIYRNDNLEIDGDTVKGKVEDVIEYLKYELAHQCMSEVGYDELVYNGREIIDTIESIVNNVEMNKIIKVFVHPMDGSLCYETEEDNEDC